MLSGGVVVKVVVDTLNTRFQSLVDIDFRFQTYCKGNEKSDEPHRRCTSFLEDRVPLIVQY